MCAEPYTVTVVFASNARGMLPLSVAAWSVAEQAHDSTVCDICILSDGIPAAQQEELRALVRRAGERHRVRFIEIDRVLPEGLKVVGERWPRVAWARVFLPDLDLNDPDAMNGVYARVCLSVLPTGMVGLMLAAMFAATMSTLAGSYNAIANVLTNDVYLRFFGTGSEARTSVRVGRAMTLLLGVAVIVLTLALRFVQGAGDLMDLSNRVFAVMLPPISLTMVLGVLCRRMTKRAGMAAILSGIVVGLGVFALGFCVPALAPYRETVPMTALTSVATLLGAAVGTFWLRDSAAERESVDAFFVRLSKGGE